ncbi:MAG: hypothetical protein HXY34_09970 [Candidatus Thorarchaeota archaeon]|nr:hypothetical protein [Candidatus Thorarchaeota archaeon]
MRTRTPITELVGEVSSSVNRSLLIRRLFFDLHTPFREIRELAFPELFNTGRPRVTARRNADIEILAALGCDDWLEYTVLRSRTFPSQKRRAPHLIITEQSTQRSSDSFRQV